MISRQVIFAVVTIASLSPALCFASPEKASVKACASAFASSIASQTGTAPGYKVDYRPNAGSTLTDFYPSEYTFTLEARNPKTGVAIARASCSADSRGTVTAITAMPLTAGLSAQ